MSEGPQTAGPVGDATNEDSMSFASPFIPTKLPPALDATSGAYKLKEQLQEKLMFRSESGRWSSVREVLKVLRLGSAIEGMWIMPGELQTGLRDRLGLTVPDGPFLRLLAAARRDGHGRVHFGDFVASIATPDFAKRQWVEVSEERSREHRKQYKLPSSKQGFFEATLPKYVIRDVDELEHALVLAIERKVGSNGIHRLSARLFPRRDKKAMSRAEFHDALISKMGFLCDRQTSDKLFERFDANHDNTVELFEFVRGVLPPDFTSRLWSSQSEDTAEANIKRKAAEMRSWAAKQPKPFRPLPQTAAVSGILPSTNLDNSSASGVMPPLNVGMPPPPGPGKAIRSPRARTIDEILGDMKFTAERHTSGSIRHVQSFLRQTWTITPTDALPEHIGLARFKRGLPRLNVVEERDLRVLAARYLDKETGRVRFGQLFRDLMNARTGMELNETADWRSASNRAPWSPRRDAAMTDAMRESMRQEGGGDGLGGKRMFPQGTMGVPPDLVKAMSKTYSCRPFSGSSLASASEDQREARGATPREPSAPGPPPSPASRASPRQRAHQRKPRGAGQPTRRSPRQPGARGLSIQGTPASPRAPGGR